MKWWNAKNSQIAYNNILCTLDNYLTVLVWGFKDVKNYSKIHCSNTMEYSVLGDVELSPISTYFIVIWDV